jgi:putative cardiolipin synthase
VSLDAALASVLERLSDEQITALARACEPLVRPGASATGVAAAGAPPASHAAIADLMSNWAADRQMTGAGVALALRLGLECRRDADARRSRAVWTGPGTATDQRLTAAVLHEIVAGATERILLVSYAAYTLAELAADLEAAVERGCEVDAVFETEEDSAGAYTGPHAQPFAAVPGIRRWRWPAAHRPAGAVLHAKLVVIDGRRALVSSANLTHRALTSNIEAGVLIADPDLAQTLEHHIRGLIDGGVLLPAP